MESNKSKFSKLSKYLVNEIFSFLDSYQIIKEAVKINKKSKRSIVDLIERLDFSENKIGKDEVQLIKKLNLKKLEYLNLKDNEIGDDEARLIMESEMKKLKSLILSENNISENGLKNTKFAQFENLEVFDLCYNKIKNLEGLIKSENFPKLNISALLQEYISSSYEFQRRQYHYLKFTVKNINNDQYYTGKLKVLIRNINIIFTEFINKEEKPDRLISIDVYTKKESLYKEIVIEMGFEKKCTFKKLEEIGNKFINEKYNYQELINNYLVYSKCSNYGNKLKWFNRD